MAEQTTTEQTVWQKINETTTSGIQSLDKMTDSMVDTISPNASQLDNLVSNFSNTSMLSNLLTSNSPTLNIKQGLEELCKFIIEFEPSKFSFQALLQKFWDFLGKQIKKIIKKIVQQLILALYNAALKLRRMVISKLKEFLSEYVADACMSGLQDHLEDLMNPKNALSIKEFCSSTNDIITTTCKNVDDALTSLRDTVLGIYNTLTGSAYSAAKLAYDEACSEKAIASVIEEATINGNIECETIEEYMIAVEQAEKGLADATIKEELAKAKMAALAEESIWEHEFWDKKWKQLVQTLYEMACSRTASYAQSEDFGLKAGIQADIKKFMQGCLFQQALKTSKNIDPNGLSADVLNKISNLAQNGEMMDAYNIALAAGIDLSSQDFQIQLPSSNGWVSTVYGDPFAFSPETPINASQIAKYLTDDMPTTSEMLDGNINSDTLSKSYVADNWNSSDSAAAAVANILSSETDVNNQVIAGQEAVGKTMTTAQSTVSVTDSNVVVIGSTSTIASITKSTTKESIRTENSTNGNEFSDYLNNDFINDVNREANA